jgi:hypothetical protein
LPLNDLYPNPKKASPDSPSDDLFANPAPTSGVRELISLEKKLYYPLQASAAACFFSIFSQPTSQVTNSIQENPLATRSKLSAQGRGIQRSHNTTLWDSVQAIC